MLLLPNSEPPREKRLPEPLPVAELLLLPKPLLRLLRLLPRPLLLLPRPLLPSPLPLLLPSPLLLPKLLHPDALLLKALSEVRELLLPVDERRSAVLRPRAPFCSSSIACSTSGGAV